MRELNMSCEGGRDITRHWRLKGERPLLGTIVKLEIVSPNPGVHHEKVVVLASSGTTWQMDKRKYELQDDGSFKFPPMPERATDSDEKSE